VLEDRISRLQNELEFENNLDFHQDHSILKKAKQIFASKEKTSTKLAEVRSIKKENRQLAKHLAALETQMEQQVFQDEQKKVTTDMLHKEKDELKSNLDEYEVILKELIKPPELEVSLFDAVSHQKSGRSKSVSNTQLDYIIPFQSGPSFTHSLPVSIQKTIQLLQKLPGAFRDLRFEKKVDTIDALFNSKNVAMKLFKEIQELQEKVRGSGGFRFKNDLSKKISHFRLVSNAISRFHFS
jgi:hypothetical protein